MSSKVSTINSDKIRVRIGVLIEQAPWAPGAGGVASTEPDSFAGARAALVLVALQIYPVLVRKFPDVAITKLCESHPKDCVTGVANGMAVRTEVDATAAPPDTPPQRVQVWIPVRSESSNKLLEPMSVRLCVWYALLKCTNSVRGETALLAGARELEKEWRDVYSTKVPLDVIHLVWMGVISEEWVKEHTAAVGSNAASIGSALGLWWPPPQQAITFVEMQRQRAELKEVRSAVHAAEMGIRREMIAQAALSRTSSLQQTPPK